MSFRDLKNFTEMMKTLGYPRLISIDNFRTPNFELVADILYWMVHRIDESADISDDISTEDKRIKFLTSVATSVSQTIQIRLKLKSLYRGDGYAVKELLKVAKFLNEAQKMPIDATIDSIDEIEQSNLLNNLRNCQNMGSKIVETGSKLHELLGTEKYVRYDRDQVLSFLDEMSHNIENNQISKQMESSILSMINNIKDDISSMSNNIEQLKSDIDSLTKKIDRKTSEYQRLLKRLKSLKSVKPAFMDEFLNLEKEHKKLYQLYIIKYRNYHYLESEFDKYRKLEMSKNLDHQKKLKLVQKKLRAQELKMLRGGDMADIESSMHHDATFEGLVDDIPSSAERDRTNRTNRSTNRSNYQNRDKQSGNQRGGYMKMNNVSNNNNSGSDMSGITTSNTSDDDDGLSGTNDDSNVSGGGRDGDDVSGSMSGDSLGSLSDLNF